MTQDKINHMQDLINQAKDLNSTIEKLNEIISFADTQNTYDRLSFIAVKINMIDAKYRDGVFAAIDDYCIREIDVLNKEFEAL